MTSKFAELVAVPIRALRRAGLVWSLSLAALIVLTVAFYPAFRDEPELGDLVAGMPQSLIDALGLADLASPEGFLRANLYAVLVPLLVAVAGVLLMNAQTAADEDRGRMEPYLAQPVVRSGLFGGRVTGVVVWLIIIGIVMLGAQLASDAAFGLEVPAGRVVATIVLCVLLGLFHAGVAATVAGWTGRPGLVMGIGVGLVVAGYVASALFPISDVLAPWRHLSPWDWAFGTDPLTGDAEVWRYLAVGLPALVLSALGAWLFSRRDVVAA